MEQRLRVRIAAMTLTALLAAVVSAAPLHAEDNIEKAGVITGATVGNLVFVPLKAIAFSMGAFSGALSFVVTGGDREVTRQVWRDTLQGPYFITPELAKKAIGERPELGIKE
jgi:hypothetical protein